MSRRTTASPWTRRASAALAEAKERSRATAVEKVGQDVAVYAETACQQLQGSGRVAPEGVRTASMKIWPRQTRSPPVLSTAAAWSEATSANQVELVLPETPFYVESGGQISDTGEIYYWPKIWMQPAWTVTVTGHAPPRSRADCPHRQGDSGTVRVGDPAEAAIDTERRWDIMRNHTATHVLQAALREQLGSHVHQAGSLVAPDRLRFDFTHGAAADARGPGRHRTPRQRNHPGELPGQHALDDLQAGAFKEGVTALFGEKYGDEVRVVSFGEEEGISMELCGGTHVDSTAEIGGFRILNEGSVAAGVRRIEIATGRGAEQLVEERWARSAKWPACCASSRRTTTAAVQAIAGAESGLAARAGPIAPEAAPSRAPKRCSNQALRWMASRCWRCRCLPATSTPCAR
jgi:alanyl-tRNA synthetase